MRFGELTTVILLHSQVPKVVLGNDQFKYFETGHMCKYLSSTRYCNKPLDGECHTKQGLACRKAEYLDTMPVRNKPCWLCPTTLTAANRYLPVFRLSTNFIHFTRYPVLAVTFSKGVLLFKMRGLVTLTRVILWLASSRVCYKNDDFKYDSWELDTLAVVLVDDRKK